MPGKILGLDIGTDSITAVQVTSGLKGYQITDYARVLYGGKEDLETALAELSQLMSLKSDTYYASIPEEMVSYRNIRMPFKEPKKIRQTLPFELETSVPFPIDDLIIDFIISNRSIQSEILAVSVKKTAISEYLRQMQVYGIDPDVLDIRCIPMVSYLLNQEETPDNGIFLKIGRIRNTIVLFQNRSIVLTRSFADGNLDLAKSVPDVSIIALEDSPPNEEIESSLKSICTMVQNTIHSYRWQANENPRPEKVFFTGIGALYPETADLLARFLELPVEKINLRRGKKVGMEMSISRDWNPVLMDGALALAIRDDKTRKGFNLRKDEFEVKKESAGFMKEIRRVAFFVVLLLVFVAADLGIDYYFLGKRYRELDLEIRNVFRQTFPGVKRIIDPVQQMKVRLNEIRSSATSSPGMDSNRKVLDLLKDISIRIPRDLDVHVTRMVIDPDTARISGDTDTFNTVDNIKSNLEPSALYNNVTISSANLDRSGNRVKFEVRLDLAKK